MKKFNNSQKLAGEMAIRSLSDKAAEFYNGADPLDVFEYEEDGAKLYAYTGAFGERDGMTFEELESDFEEMYKMSFEDFQKEALAENGVQNDSNTAWVEVINSNTVLELMRFLTTKKTSHLKHPYFWKKILMRTRGKIYTRNIWMRTEQNYNNFWISKTDKKDRFGGLFLLPKIGKIKCGKFSNLTNRITII